MMGWLKLGKQAGGGTSQHLRLCLASTRRRAALQKDVPQTLSCCWLQFTVPKIAYRGSASALVWIAQREQQGEAGRRNEGSQASDTIGQWNTVRKVCEHKAALIRDTRWASSQKRQQSAGLRPMEGVTITIGAAASGSLAVVAAAPHLRPTELCLSSIDAAVFRHKRYADLISRVSLAPQSKPRTNS